MDEVDSAPLDLTVNKSPEVVAKVEIDPVEFEEYDEVDGMELDVGVPLDLTSSAAVAHKSPVPISARSPLARSPLGRLPLARSSPETQPPPPAAVVAPSVYRAPAVSPQIADHVPPSPLDGSGIDASYHPHRYAAEYNPFMAAAAAAAAAAVSAAPHHHQYHHHHLPVHTTYPSGLSGHDFNPIMMIPKMASSPVYVATSPESNPFYGSYECMSSRSAYDFCRFPYYGGAHSERLSPESTTVDANVCSGGGDDVRDVDPEEIAAIYRQTDFVAFRQRYLESLGPPKNFEKMRRSVPNKKPPGPDGQQSDQTYVMKRKKNNEAAKRSRDAKRQKYIENQISVMYLTKKVSEMKEIKRRLLMSM
ncbi:uncharacterized protein LOC126894258 [Daktulosphaira vitifoliae]|uniref:uncharacterized protein LOC126894258 n=1 Tax=Daktulosphaira vitifoliae TaxID=58002 RepID=UPI0021AA86FF|nr:uncharacterized protein LOC126894258 [Daktulosphaira vitifoliae]